MTTTSISTFGEIEPGVTYVDRPGAYGLWHNHLGDYAVIQTGQGYFLPGGGVETGESFEVALGRELVEEVGCRLTRSEFYASATQYHYSQHYGQHFKKVGHFFYMDAEPIPGQIPDADHVLHWWPRERLELELSQEFQRWAARVSRR